MGEDVAVSSAAPAAGADPGLAAEAVRLLGELIRIDTTNPPGAERPAQELLAQTLADAGFDCELLEAEPGRANLVARLESEAPGETLCLLGHLDTVPADRAEWSFDPWGGDVVDGVVRGRGAQDMKGQVAAEVAAAASLARRGWRPARGELKLVLTADEETGAALGAAWLCEEHPEKVRADLVVNEGGGTAFELDGRRFYTLCVGEKGIARFSLRARGVAGHASVPELGDNALIKLAPALERLRHQPPLEPTEAGVELLARLGGEPVAAEPEAVAEAVERLALRAPQLAAFLVEPMLRVTLAPTTISASPKDNVIPSRAEVLVDCRLPPGVGPEHARERAREVLGEIADGLEIEFGALALGNGSPADTPLARLIAAWVAEHDPGATVVPIVMAGFSDSHWFRKAFDAATVYGFCPQRDFDLTTAAPLMHGADERAATADVGLAARFYADLPRLVLG